CAREEDYYAMDYW
nr:immunoglobulin heavy chain junction region [Mus musculus]